MGSDEMRHGVLGASLRECHRSRNPKTWSRSRSRTDLDVGGVVSSSLRAEVQAAGVQAVPVAQAAQDPEEAEAEVEAEAGPGGAVAVAGRQGLLGHPRTCT